MGFYYTQKLLYQFSFCKANIAIFSFTAQTMIVNVRLKRSTELSQSMFLTKNQETTIFALNNIRIKET